MAEKIKTSKLFKNSNILLFVVSAVLAFLIWFIMSLTAFPDTAITLKNVPIDYSFEGSYADVVGISIMSKPTEMANIKIEGQRYLIGDYTAEDVHIGVNVDSVRGPGQYDLSLVVTSKNGDAMKVLQVEPQTVKVEFDYMVTKTFSVADGTLKADISNITAASGYFIDPNEVEITPSTVEVSGPRDYVDKITSCVVGVNAASTVRSNVETSNTSLTMYNESNIMFSDKISASESSFRLNVPVYMRKDLKLEVQVQPYFNQFDVSSLEYTVTPASISVRSQNERLASIDTIPFGYIPLNSIMPGSEFTYTIHDSSYYTNISGNEYATVKFDLDGYSTKTVTISNSQMYPINVPEGYKVTIETDKLRNITLVGPTDVIEQIDSSDVIAQLDMMDYNFSEGFAMYYIQIYLPNHDNCWCYGQHQVYLNIEKTPDEINITEP